MIRSFDKSFIIGEITISKSAEDQSNLLENIVEFYNKFRPRTKEGRMNKEIYLIGQIFFMKVANKLKIRSKKVYFH